MSHKIFESGIWPPSFLEATVVPLHKANKASFFPSDFRPVSLTSVLGKVVERILLKRLKAELPPLWAFNQFSAIPGASAGEAVTSIVDTISQAPCVAIFVDFADAFCHVNCDEAARTAERLGAPAYCCSIISSFGQARNFRVRVGNRASTKRTISGGVPQGSVLGPIIFALWVHDLSSQLRELDPLVRTIWMADDLTIIVPLSTDLQVTIDKLCTAISSWCELRGLPISPKTNAMFFRPEAGGRRRALANITLGGVSVPLLSAKSDVVKVLGLWLDPYLTFSSHASRLCSTLRSMAAGLRWTLTHTWFKRSMGFAVGPSRLMYALHCFWSNLSEAAKKDLNVAYHAVIKAALSLPKWCSKDPARLEGGFPSLPVMCSKQRWKFLEKSKRMRDSVLVELEAVKRHDELDREPAPHDIPYPKPHTFIAHPPRIVLSPPGGHRKPKEIECAAPEVVAALCRSSVERVSVEGKNCSLFIATDGSADPRRTGTSCVVRFSSYEDMLAGRIGEEFAEHHPDGACSYRCEARAVLRALRKEDWWESNGEGRTAIVVTDAQGLLSALQLGPWCQRSTCEKQIWARIIELSSKGWTLKFCFVFSHVGVPANEAADERAEHYSGVDGLEVASNWIVDTVRNRSQKESWEEFKGSEHFRARWDKKLHSGTNQDYNTAYRIGGVSTQRLLTRARCAAVVGVDPMPGASPSIECRRCKGPMSTEHLFNCPLLPPQLQEFHGVTPEHLFSPEADVLERALRCVLTAISLLCPEQSPSALENASQISAA